MLPAGMSAAAATAEVSGQGVRCKARRVYLRELCVGMGRATAVGPRFPRLLLVWSFFLVSVVVVVGWMSCSVSRNYPCSSVSPLVPLLPFIISSRYLFSFVFLPERGGYRGVGRETVSL